MSDLTTILANSNVAARQGNPSGTAYEIDQDQYGLASNTLLSYSGLAANTKLRNELGIAIGEKPKVSIDGKPVAQLRKESRLQKAARKAAPAAAASTANLTPSLFVNQAAVRDSRFIRNKLSTTKVTPPQGLLASFPEHQPTHHEACITREPLRELFERRKKKIRVSLTHDIFENPLTTPNSKSTAKTARNKIVNSSPSTNILIEDSFELGWDTPRTKRALLENYHRVEK